MARNPKSDIVHKHNGLLGPVAMAKSAMIGVVNSSSTSDQAKSKANELFAHIAELYNEIKNNPQY